MVIVRFEEVVDRYLALVGFIPIVIGMAGNVGTQSLTVVVRGLATRRIEVKQFWSVTSKEVLTGVLLGILYGAALGVFGFLEVHGSPGVNAVLVALVLGGASSVAMVIAALVGSAMPLLLARLHIDPAVATGPFVTTAVDVLGVLVYFNIASAFL
jgi:magnesium transporter